MTGFDLEKVRDILAGAFDDDDFDELLLFGLDIDRAKIVKNDALNTVVLNVLKKATQGGWDALLIAKAAQRRPHRADVQDIARKYGASLVGEFKRSAGSEKAVRDAYREFQLAPPGFPTEEQLGTLEKTIDPANPMFNMTDWVSRAARIEGRVCRLEIDGAPKGTGFLVGPDTVLTNHHVVKPAIENPALLSKVRARFDYKQFRDGKILSGTLVDVAEILDSSPCTDGEAAGKPGPDDPGGEYLDYAVVRLKGKPGVDPVTVAGAVAPGPARGWVRVPDGAIDRGPFAYDFPVLIAQHPQGEPLRLAIEWKSVIGLNGAANRVKHRTNTLAGSSGSPCFDRFWNLIALHHYGDPGYVTKPQFNQAVPVAAIRQRLTDRGHAGALGGDCD